MTKRPRLTVQQMRSVADHRLGDARALQHTKVNARATGAMYLAGLTIDCLLKAKLSEEYPELVTADPETLTKANQERHRLLHKEHDPGRILELLPSVQRKLAARGSRERTRLLNMLRTICENWSIHIRYSTKVRTMHDVANFIGNVDEVKECLK